MNTLREIKLPLFFIGFILSAYLNVFMLLLYLALVFFGATYFKQLRKLEKEDKL